MTKAEFAKCWEIAQSDADLSGIDDSILHGCALRDFVPVTTTKEVIAKFLRWHCFNLNGSVDTAELNGMAKILKRKVEVV